MSSTQNTESDMFQVGNIIKVFSAGNSGFALVKILSLIERKLDYELDYKCVFLCDMVVYSYHREPAFSHKHTFHWTNDETYQGELSNYSSIFLDLDLGV